MSILEKFLEDIAPVHEQHADISIHSIYNNTYVNIHVPVFIACNSDAGRVEREIRHYIIIFLNASFVLLPSRSTASANTTLDEEESDTTNVRNTVTKLESRWVYDARTPDLDSA